MSLGCPWGGGGGEGRAAWLALPVAMHAEGGGSAAPATTPSACELEAGLRRF